MLSAKAARFSIEELGVRIHRTSVELRVAELAINTRFEFNFERVIGLIPKAEDLLVHVDFTVMYRIASESGTDI